MNLKFIDRLLIYCPLLSIVICSSFMNLGSASSEDVAVQKTSHLRTLTSSSSSEFHFSSSAFSSPTQTSFGLSEPPSPSDSSNSITSTPDSSACPFQTPSSSTSSRSVKPPHLDLGDSAFSTHSLRGPLKIEGILYLLEQIESDHVNETQAIQAFMALEKFLPDFPDKQKMLDTLKKTLCYGILARNLVSSSVDGMPRSRCRDEALKPTTSAFERGMGRYPFGRGCP